jgi:hypothetical protein
MRHIHGPPRPTMRLAGRRALLRGSPRALPGHICLLMTPWTHRSLEYVHRHEALDSFMVCLTNVAH